ncbi:hypothetical protein Ppa06_54940 [Planomonospora parontospora subsp. parontospora]|uniref:Uncharacterized protein n=2 Tax=Planomonospora parontospora TaxID=58119 RepID=A0AA37BLQ8_9ACTN|nr:hypothetical protein GCM10010126_56820 [Planomonospora parontospora]GII11696.1 hypothetical protein Ppa06_54940 [Planomonospora parontospora subsp. parontospora]
MLADDGVVLARASRSGPFRRFSRVTRARAVPAPDRSPITGRGAFPAVGFLSGGRDV